MGEEWKAQKTFISYSWSTFEHEEWVLELAERLVNNGVEVVLDKWDSTEGQNLNAFMQRCVTDPTIEKVLVICDKIYAEKADGFKGGVGTETVIISNEVYQDVEQTKFIAIVAERDDAGNAYMPTYLKGTKYIDMSNAQNYEDGFEKLIRNLYRKPEYRKPKLGNAPSFLLEEKKTILNSNTELRKLIYLVNKNPKKTDILVNEFLEHIRQDFISFSLKSPNRDELENKIFQQLNEITALRDIYLEFLEFYIMETEEIDDYLLIEFFQSLYPLIYTKENNPYFDNQFDHMKFFVMEIIIYTIALLYKYKKYYVIKEIITSSYIVRDHLNNENIGSIGTFRFYPELIESVKLPSTQQKYISNAGQLIIERASFKNITSNELIQADFLIYFLTFIFDKNDYINGWYPPTIPYFSKEKIEFVSKLKSMKFFKSCKLLFGEIDLENLREKIKEFEEYLTSNAPASMSRYYLRYLFSDPEEIAKY